MRVEGEIRPTDGAGENDQVDEHGEVVPLFTKGGTGEGTDGEASNEKQQGNNSKSKGDGLLTRGNVLKLALGGLAGAYAWSQSLLPIPSVSRLAPLQVTVGILVYAWVSGSGRRRRERLQLSARLSQLVGDPSEELLEELTRRKLLEEMPPWVIFQHFERVSWLNKLVANLWPSVKEAVKVMVLQEVNPLLDKVKPAALSLLELEESFDLGKLPPVLSGVHVSEASGARGHRQLVVDLDLKLATDSGISVRAKAKGLGIRVELLDLQIFGVIRIILTPIVDTLPCVGGMLISFLKTPHVDFALKVQGSDVMGIPGLDGIIQNAIKDVLNSLFLWPKRFPVEIIPDAMDEADKKEDIRGMLYVEVVSCKDLPKTDLTSPADPYLKLHVKPARTYSTRTIMDNPNPVFKEVFQFVVHDVERERLTIECFDFDHVGYDDKVCKLEVPLNRLVPQDTMKPELLSQSLPFEPYEATYSSKAVNRVAAKLKGTLLAPTNPTIQKHNLGTVQLRSLYIDFDAEDFELPKECFTLPPSGILKVSLRAVTDLHRISGDRSLGGRHVLFEVSVAGKVKRTHDYVVKGDHSICVGEDIDFVGVDSAVDSTLKIAIIKRPRTYSLTSKEKTIATLEMNISELENDDVYSFVETLVGVKTGVLALDLQYNVSEEVKEFRAKQKTRTSFSHKGSRH